MRIPCTACRGEALDLVDYKREDRVSCQRCKGTGKDPTPTQEDIDRHKRSIRPHSPDAYALVEKVLRNREVLKVANRAAELRFWIEQAADLPDAVKYWSVKLVDIEGELQQLIDSL